ncbi:TetR/AcrR family transcriptional regulator [Paraglaciecola arctica]|uniref:Transcriptional regulator n=1 Tax=Paraglaciecola arctica BSs20135 TaxID=493475 RepID=K6YW56_9ALTE|nr:TetR/AcrR family transcriptional regulator [Paraglaciecola arctica]GAC20953.1 transcriptional regulator [Paraglaciecola arctica BSs20135]
MSDKNITSAICEADYIPREKGLLRRDKILDAATEIFCRSGFDAANLQEIMSQAGGSLATLYRLFGNKEGLFQAVIERTSGQLIDKLSSSFAQEQDPVDVLHTMGIGFLDLLISPQVGAIHRLLISESGRYPQLREIFIKTAPERNLRAVADYLQSLVDSGYLQLVDCYMAAQQLLNMFKGNYHMRCVLGDTVVLSEEEKRRYVESAVSIFLNGCKTKT